MDLVGLNRQDLEYAPQLGYASHGGAECVFLCPLRRNRQQARRVWCYKYGGRPQGEAERPLGFVALPEVAGMPFVGAALSPCLCRFGQ